MNLSSTRMQSELECSFFRKSSFKDCSFSSEFGDRFGSYSLQEKLWESFYFLTDSFVKYYYISDCDR